MSSLSLRRHLHLIPSCRLLLASNPMRRGTGLKPFICCSFRSSTTSPTGHPNASSVSITDVAQTMVYTTPNRTYSGPLPFDLSSIQDAESWKSTLKSIINHPEKPFSLSEEQSQQFRTLITTYSFRVAPGMVARTLRFGINLNDIDPSLIRTAAKLMDNKFLNAMDLGYFGMLLTRLPDKRSEKALVKALAYYLHKTTVQLNERSFIELCYSLYKLDGNDDSTKYFVESICNAVARSNELKTITNEQYIGDMCYALRRLDGMTGSTRYLCSIIAKLIMNTTLPSTSLPLQGETIARCCIGLRNLHNTCESTYLLVTALAEKINESNAILDSKQVVNVCYGLHALDGLDYRTKSLVKAITEKVETAKDIVLTGQGIGNACYGLQSLDGCDESTKRLVIALTKHINNSTAILNTQEISNSCYGLQSLDGRDPTTHELVNVLSKKIKLSNAKLDEQGIGNACYGLYRLQGITNSTKQLVDVLAEKIEQSDVILDGGTIGGSCYGLQSLDGNDITTKRLVNALTVKIQQCDVIMTGQSIAVTCYGLQNLNPNDITTKALIDSLLVKLQVSMNKKVELEQRQIGMIMYGIKNLHDTDYNRFMSVLGLQPTLEFMATLNSQSRNDGEKKLVYSRYLGHVLARDPQRGMKELEALSSPGNVLQDEELGLINAQYHAPDTVVALVDLHIRKLKECSTKSNNNNKLQLKIFVGKGKSSRLRVLAAIEEWLVSHGYSYVYTSYGIEIKLII